MDCHQDCHQTCHKCSSYIPKEVLLLFVAIQKSKMAAMDCDWLRHLQLLKNYFIHCHQTYHNCSCHRSIYICHKSKWKTLQVQEKRLTFAFKWPILFLLVFSGEVMFFQAMGSSVGKKVWNSTIIISYLVYHSYYSNFSWHMPVERFRPYWASCSNLVQKQAKFMPVWRCVLGKVIWYICFCRSTETLKLSVHIFKIWYNIERGAQRKVILCLFSE